MNWKSPKDPPKMERPGHASKPVLADYGKLFTPRYMLVVFWQSFLPGQPEKWFLDNESYFVDGPAREVPPPKLWCEIEECEVDASLDGLPMFAECG